MNAVGIGKIWDSMPTYTMWRVFDPSVGIYQQENEQSNMRNNTVIVIETRWPPR
jgi:hypothetical protein